MQTETQHYRELPQLSVTELRAEAQAQEAIYARGEAADDAAGLELFRRAMDHDDPAAWQAVMDVYRPILVSHAARRVVRGLVVEDDGFCVDRAFQRFWQACRRGRVHHFDDLAAILQYLKLCLGSVLLDEARSRRRQACLSLDDVAPETCLGDDPAAQVIGGVIGRELWLTIDRELNNPRERLVAHLSFVGGLTPREILARHPADFHDVYDVYRSKRNMIERLRRSSAIQDLLA
ncbi:MAG: sigma-70 family RNA polymerase sigma factor [Chloroflexi bacterium]|nr:sigma-70 family RNA polymerase sigma factor [Chloroflexota bacterium]